MNDLKKFGGTLTNWTIHNLTIPDEALVEFEKKGVLPQLMTAEVVDDPLGRWTPGWQMKSSLIVSIDREKGIIETLNTIYKVDEKELPEGDLGNIAASIYF